MERLSRKFYPFSNLKNYSGDVYSFEHSFERKMSLGAPVKCNIGFYNWFYGKEIYPSNEIS